jgi:hypothetical protein
VSFKCDYCGKPQPSGTKPVLQTPSDSWRKKTYEYFDQESEVIMRVEGREPLAEFKTCHECLGVSVPKAPVVEMRTFLLQTQGYHNHARGCKGFKTIKSWDRNGDEVKEQIPCRVCALIERDFAAFPATVLSICIEDHMVRPLKTPIYLLVRDKMIDRVSDGNVFTSKRAFADGVVAIGALKTFSTLNPKLLRG